MVIDTATSPPVLRCGPELVLVGGYRHAAAVLMDHDRFPTSPDRGPLNGTIPTLFGTHPPQHAHARRIVAATISREQIDAARPLIDRTAGELIASAQQRDSADLVADFADQLAARVVARLLGVPPADESRIYGLVQDLAPATLLPRHISDASRARAAAALQAWIQSQIELRRSARAPHDIITKLLDPNPHTGIPFTDDELVVHIHTLLLAGLGGVRRLVANALYELLRIPGRYAAVRDDPGLIPAAVNESLRHDPPGTYATPRICVRHTWIDGVAIAPGERILVDIAAANRDPARWSSPDRFELGRRRLHHLSFGRGTHICPGAYLARTIATRALDAFTKRIDRVALADSYVYEERGAPGSHGPTRLDVVFEAPHSKEASPWQ